MEISPEIIKNLLVSLVNPKYPDLIHDYMVKSSEVNGWKAFAIGVIVEPERYNEMETYNGNPFSGLDSKVEKDVKNTLKYVGLGPTNSTVSLYVVDDEWAELSDLMGKFLKSDYTPERYRESLGIRSKRYKVVNKDNNTIVIETDADADLLNGELKDNVMDFLSNNMEINPDLQIIFKNKWKNNI